MTFERNIFSFIIVSLSLISCCTSILRNDFLNNYLHEEGGYDFRAFPSYFSSIEGIKTHNSGKIETRVISDLGKFRRLAALVKTINVQNFGAKGDGNTDDSKAFQNAWKEACSSLEAIIFLVPQTKIFFLKPITFAGPCKAQITMQIAGTLVASDDLSDYIRDEKHWLVFENIQNLKTEGGGTINGNGKIWWQNSCKINKANPCKKAPTALTFYNCKNLEITNLKIKDAQQIQVSIEKCTDVEVSNVVVSAPGNSPNTDGIHVSRTQNIQIKSCIIGTGDDCISIESGTKNMTASDITCGPGHGISVGSLGSENSQDYVSDIVVDGAKLSGTTNGLRIKTYQGGSGSASNIKFQNVELKNVKNPIIIDQNYCDQASPCKQHNSAVQVKNVVYQNIKGTSDSDVAIDFECSKNYPCQGIVLQNVNLVTQGGGSTKAKCTNVNLKNIGTVSPSCS